MPQNGPHNPKSREYLTNPPPFLQDTLAYLCFSVFGVTESKSVQKTSKSDEFFENKIFVRLKCVFAPYLALERCVGGPFFKTFLAKIR